MSLSTLLEAAKYLDYLDSNNQQTQVQFQPHQNQQAIKKPVRRQRSSKKNAADAMVAMSLPTSSRPLQTHGVPIPMVANNDNHQATSLSSSFTTGSPLSSFASTALFCSKASNVTSASSSAASSLSSSDSSSSCGEILMGDNEFSQTLGGTSTGSIGSKRSKGKMTHKNNSNNNHHNYHLTHQQYETNHQYVNQQFSSSVGNNNQSIARYIAATSVGPQLVTMTTNNGVASTSAPIDSSLRAGHVIHAANNGAILSATPGTNFDGGHFSIATSNGFRSHQQQAIGGHEGQTFSVAAGSFASDNQISGSPNSRPSLIMTRVQPMILNSLSPSAQGIMAFQPATTSSPTSSSSSYSRHRELHKTLEKNRRAHLRYCFELLKSELPASECVDKKTSHINIIKSAIRYVLALRQQETEIDNELMRLTKIKNDLTENLSNLRNNQPLSNQQQQQNLPTPTTSDPQQLKQEQQMEHQPAAEQQLSFLLSQSKID